MIEEHEPNKLKAEIYRLRYEHSKLDQAKSLLNSQQYEIEKVKKYRQELQEHMTHFKAEEEKKREELNATIQQQRVQIADKEKQIKEKQGSISTME